MRATTKEQGFYSQIFKLVLPIVIQNLLSAAVNSADVVMLNYVGQSAISAVSLASNYANVLFMVYYGLGTGATLLCAQYFGKAICEQFRLSRESHFDSPSSSPSLWQELLLPCHR